MTKLTDLYNNFTRIDLDARGGYARVADVVIRQENGEFVHRAFKLMRHELDGKQVGIQRFENELKILLEIAKDKDAPSPITRIYDSGFVQVELSMSLHNRVDPDPEIEIVSTGLDFQKFLALKPAFMNHEHDRWLPYLVVELAPYHDSLLRQIKPETPRTILNYDRLPVYTIIEMASQILDVMDYLHKKLRYAYIDWKPEHIYWNEATRELKIIDWNVNTNLNDESWEMKTIREDLRMFCGAALYCSLALTDPEDLDKSIGPEPILPKNLIPTIRPRYWTDKPNFYQRESILDEKIKSLVQKGLDPKQGFNTPQELRKALQSAKLPVDAVQHYRRARSYIAAKDFSYAELALEVAIETATKAGVNYTDAEQLLENVRDLLKVSEDKQKFKLALENKKWGEAFRLYIYTVALDPASTIWKYVKKHLNRTRIIQIIGGIILLITAMFLSYLFVKNKNFDFPPFATATFTYTPTPRKTVTPPPATFSATTIPTLFTESPTNTVAPTSASVVILAYGKLTQYIYPLEEPNGNYISIMLPAKQPVVILERIDFQGGVWLKCSWQFEGVVGEGWFPEKNVQIGLPPTPTP